MAPTLEAALYLLQTGLRIIFVAHGDVLEGLGAELTDERRGECWQYIFLKRF